MRSAFREIYIIICYEQGDGGDPLMVLNGGNYEFAGMNAVNNCGASYTQGFPRLYIRISGKSQDI